MNKKLNFQVQEALQIHSGIEINKHRQISWRKCTFQNKQMSFIFMYL